MDKTQDALAIYDLHVEIDELKKQSKQHDDTIRTYMSEIKNAHEQKELLQFQLIKLKAKLSQTLAKQAQARQQQEPPA